MTKLRKRESYNLKEAAKYCRISYRLLKKNIEAGKIPCHKLGPRTYRINRSELERFLRGAYHTFKTPQPKQEKEE